jgi:uncharacterized protein
MKNINSQTEFLELITPMLENKEFMITQSTIHHGIKKLNHSMKVAYYSYRIAKLFKFDYISVARGGILHDFFLSNCNGKSICKEAMVLTYNHHNIALKNAKKQFKLNKKEKDIIVKHMFPMVLKLPKYKESYLVAFVDKVIGAVESLGKFRKLLNYKILSEVVPAFILTIGLLK